jgi:phosphohistidine phosphatase
MDLILWRHAEASELESAGDDLERALTPKGERQAQRMGEWLNQRLAHSTRILVSPALRCQQTARALGRSFKTASALAPGDARALLRNGALARLGRAGARRRSPADARLFRLRCCSPS